MEIIKFIDFEDNFPKLSLLKWWIYITACTELLAKLQNWLSDPFAIACQFHQTFPQKFCVHCLLKVCNMATRAVIESELQTFDEVSCTVVSRCKIFWFISAIRNFKLEGYQLAFYRMIWRKVKCNLNMPWDNLSIHKPAKTSAFALHIAFLWQEGLNSNSLSFNLSHNINISNPIINL